MSNKYFDGFVSSTGATDPIDDDLKAVCTAAAAKTKEKMDQMHMADAVTEVFNIFRRCNKYIDETEPWVLAKDEANRNRLSEVMYNLVEGICIGANLLKPFMPDTADKILMMLYGTERDFDLLSEFGVYRSGTKVTDTPEVLFARKKLEDVMTEVSAIQEAQRKEYESENH